MQRGEGPRVSAALLVLFVLVAGCEDRKAEVQDDHEADSRPNIVLVMAEDMGPRIGVYGDPVARTPNLDRLAREGAHYSRAFTTSGVCAPSRAAIVTGLHQNVWGAGHMRAAAGGYTASPEPGVKAFPELLRAAGYFTINDGKTDYQMGLRFGGAYGGPATLWDDGNTTDWSGRAPGQPFFAFVNLMQTHESQVWPTWMPPNGWMTLALWPIRIWNHLQWPLRTDPARISIPPYYPDTPTVRADLARHYNNIAAMDAAVGALLARLDEEGLARNTVVIFTSDHGDGLPRAKRWLYDSGLHVPLIIRWPGVTQAGTERTRLVSMVDLAPTILSMARAEPPDWLTGRIFVGPEEQAPRVYAYAAGDRIDEQPDTVRAVRDRRYKYIRHYRPELPYVLDSDFRDQMPMMRELRVRHDRGELSETAAQWFRTTRDAEELFDTREDPHEVVNLARDPAHASTLTRMRAALDDWLAHQVDLGFVPEEELRTRFFPGGIQPTTLPPTVQTEHGWVRVENSTEGASIEVRVGRGPWRLYTGPICMSANGAVAARAQRYGWKPSDVVEAERGDPPFSCARR